MTCDAGVCIENLDIQPGWVQCAGGDSPLVKITKHPTEDRYRVLVTCPSDKSNDSKPQSEE